MRHFFSGFPLMQEYEGMSSYIKTILPPKWMVYHLSTYANLLYSTSDLLARVFTAAKLTCVLAVALDPPKLSKPQRSVQTVLTYPLNNTNINIWRRSDIALGRRVSRSEPILSIESGRVFHVLWGTVGR